MSVDKLVDSTQLDADLTSVANAIRTKGGTSAALAFPAEFVSAIQAIPTGGGAAFAHGDFTPTEDLTSYTVDTGGDYDNFVMYRVAQGSTSVRSLRALMWKNLEYRKPLLVATTNNTGSGIQGFYNQQSGYITKSGSSFVYSNGTQKLAAGEQYEWVAW